ncbi:MAG: hypothetical protein A2722_02095 [Candidatus Doudnabacteria bacterium RIFCSPHIGHO2_01_FULL_50_11]|uniref:Uncharacterized protein n=1 Tax=Candidatus Doudnabacteria bacterium RIFCSPHIGHO2_01_FULL_50_11 TaxID=1817828 RepID=A0A1F5PI50_9BACT|nr:MAG: hypothetical protein A2722_02095 [Candidatus Doudnabacteria bacterium RIFCSPHIGHO2_01_FULL_50_11]HLC45045.1 hypothetical protein [Patescibacteria group bacterium]
MNIFRDHVLTWWQVGIVKLCLLSIGIAVGAQWHEVFAPYVMVLVVVGIATGVYLAAAWMMKR